MDSDRGATVDTGQRDTASHCSGCGAPSGQCSGCGRPLDPPRFCPDCGRRLTVAVSPGGYRAHCRDHGSIHPG